jgi:hypothetical protein
MIPEARTRTSTEQEDTAKRGLKRNSRMEITYRCEGIEPVTNSEELELAFFSTIDGWSY